MWKVTRKGLRAHKLRFALTALAVLLGVAFMSGTMVLTDTIRKTFDDLFADIRDGTDAYVRSSEAIESDFGPTQRGRISADLLPEIEDVDGVEAAEGEIQFYAQFVGKDGDTLGNPEQGPPTFGSNWNEVPELNPWGLEPGGSAPETADQVVMDKKSADDGGFEVGDRVTVLTQNPPREYEVAGIVKFGSADSPAGASVALFETEEAQRITDAVGEFGAISVVGDSGVSEQELVGRIRDVISDPQVEVLTGEEITAEDQDEIQDALQFISIPLFVFAGIALLVGAFIIFNTFSIVVAQRTREMALLRAIGASQRQVTTSILLESLVVGVFASLVGLAVGVGLSVLLKAALSSFGFDIPSSGIVVTTTAVVVSLVIGTVMTLVSAVVPAWRGARVPPIAAIRDVALQQGTRVIRRSVIGGTVFVVGVTGILLGLFGDVDNGIYAVALGALLVFIGATVLGPVFARRSSQIIGWPVAHLRGVTGNLARENAMRNPQRTSATAAALMIGVAIVGFFTVFASSLKASVNAQVDRAFTADFVISTGGFGGATGFSPDLAEQVADLPEVGDSTPLRFGQATIDGDDDFVVGLDPQTAEDLFDLDPRQGEVSELTPDGIAVSTKAAGDNDWEIGSRIPVQFPNGERTLTVQATYGVGLREGLSDFAVSIDGFALGYPENLDNQIYVTLASGVTPDEGRAALEQVTEPYPQAEVQDSTEFKESFSAMVNQILGLVYVLLFLAVLIALIGIANTLALSVYERTRELGLLRAVGMTRRQLRSSVRWEAVIIAILGTLIGLAIGVFFGWAVIRALRDEGFEKFAPSAGQLVTIVIAAGLAGVVAALFPARRAAKLNVLEAITTE
ncbi:MAG TPA: FtsX-like permease family protein [Acidimicrobiia bacterium]